MMRTIRNWTKLGIIVGSSLCPALVGKAEPAPATTRSYKSNQVVLIKENGKPDRRCLILSISPRPGGILMYQVRALDNGEIMSIIDRASTKKSQADAATTTSKPTRTPMTNIPKPEMPALFPPIPNTQVKQNSASPFLLNPTPINSGRDRIPATNEANRSVQPPLAPPQPCPVCTAPQPVHTTSVPSPSIASRSAPIQHSPGKASNSPNSVAAAPTQPQPAKPSFFARMKTRIFGTSQTACSTCTNGRNRAVANRPQRGPDNTQNLANNGPQDQEPPMYREPLPLGFETPFQASIPGVARINPPGARTEHHITQQTPPDPALQARINDQMQVKELRESLTNALEPSVRVLAAEKLCLQGRIHQPEIQAALMQTAQDDPSALVRSECIRFMSRAGLRDQAFLTILIAAQNDTAVSVREEAGFALQKATNK